MESKKEEVKTEKHFDFEMLDFERHNSQLSTDCEVITKRNVMKRNETKCGSERSKKRTGRKSGERQTTEERISNLDV